MKPNAWTVAAFMVCAAILAFAAGVVCWQEPVASGSIAVEGLCIGPTDEIVPPSNAEKEAGVCSGGATVSSASPDHSPPSALLRRPGNDSKGKGMPPLNPYAHFFRECATGDAKDWLLAGMSYETSKFDPNVRGGAGEIGLGQLMPAYALAYLPGGTAADLFDPRTNICVMSAMLQKQFDNLRRDGPYASWADHAKWAMFSNNSGYGNVGPLARSMPKPLRWRDFEMAGSWGNKVNWVNRMWARAQEYRAEKYIRYGIIGTVTLGAGLLLWATAG